MSEQQVSASMPTNKADADESARVEKAAGERRRAGFLSGAAGRNIGLVVALLLLCVVGFATGGERFLSVNNLMTILSLGSVLGVVAIGMTFVITTGGIDLTVGSVLGLASVWATTLATQSYGWVVMVICALAVGIGAGLLNGLIIAYGRVVAFIATLAMLVAARGLAELIAQKRTQIVDVDAFNDIFRGNLLGVPKIVWIFAIVAVLVWGIVVARRARVTTT